MNQPLQSSSLKSAMESYKLRSSDVTRASGEVADFRWLKALAEREQWLINPDSVREVEDDEQEEPEPELKKVVWRGLVCVRKVVRIPEEYVLPVVESPEVELEIGEGQGSKGEGKDIEEETGEQGQQAVVANKEQAKERLANLGKEISILSSLRHPNLVMFLGACFVENKPPQILLELCPGGTLRNRVLECKSKGKSLKQKLKDRYAKEIALGMNFLHCCREPVIHCNLKPDNVFLDVDGRVKLGDFGVAAFTQKFGYNATDLGLDKDAFRYLAPELFAENGYTEKVDLYSYAMVCYFINKMEHPFAAETLSEEFIRRILKQGERPSLSGVKSKLMKSLIRSCWALEAAERPSFAKVLEELEEHEGNDNCVVC